MCEVGSVKAYTPSDPLDVLPTVCAFIRTLRWCLKPKPKKPKQGTRAWKPNRIEPNMKNPNRPSLTWKC